VLAGGQRGQRHLAVRIRPGADAHGVHVGRSHDGVPVVLDATDAELLGHPLARLSRAIGDGDELDARLLLKSRDVPLASIATGADEAYANGSVVHACAP